MHPRRRPARTALGGFPRRRGDAPSLRRKPAPLIPFPPQARGCTRADGEVRRFPRVSPAGAGMHPTRLGRPGATPGFPRRRGDAPTERPGDSRPAKFPPQARGCTAIPRRGSKPTSVSPAGAGMHLGLHSPIPGTHRFPRRRGDAPIQVETSHASAKFPPQARGCTGSLLRVLIQGIVSPAGAGMHPGGRRPTRARPRFPRRRGDAPCGECGDSPPPGFPPQARGCTITVPTPGASEAVSPAGAGMHRTRTGPDSGRTRFPRRRGDAPLALRPAVHQVVFPPQARGCTLLVGQPDDLPVVSPAGAGMHPPPGDAAGRCACFPRRRGDAPELLLMMTVLAKFPPQARGCTDPAAVPDRRRVVSPAGAGMHRPPVATAPSRSSFPRRRGDAPFARNSQSGRPRFPPQARGCTPDVEPLVVPGVVSPAGAGMHRITKTPAMIRQSFPRRRGDAPSPTSGGGSPKSFPPQARGCTLRALARKARANVSPAGAGMHQVRSTEASAKVGFPRRRGDAPRAGRR